MEEENGRPEVALEILIVGIIVCKLNDTLLPRLLKLQERAGKFHDIRTILSWLKFENIDKTWKSILEGSLFEVRSGNLEVASEFFKYLMKQVPWYGPIYFEAFQLEENQRKFSSAFSIIRRGLMELPRYGPLWFGLIRMMETEDFRYEQRLWQLGYIPQFSKLSYFTFESLKSISKELTWRVYYEKFEAETRASCIVARGLQNSIKYPSVGYERILSKVLTNYRHNLIRSLLLCPPNLKWKLYLIAAREEIVVGNLANARNWARKAIVEVPIKSKATALIECSRIEEYAGNLINARKILNRARSELHHDWRSYFESIAFESRNKNFQAALRIAQQAVNYHNGTGRIWAIYIQLFHRLQRNQYHKDKIWNFACTSQGLKIIVRKAINEVPKSGEVWCEMGRCALNPLLPDHFNLHRAQLSLMFAIQFTPQYGDTFIEYLRLEILLKVFLKTLCEDLLFIPFFAFVSRYCSLDPESDIISSIQLLKPDFNHQSGKSINQSSIIHQIFSNEVEEYLTNIIFKQLEKVKEEEFPLLERR
jgi:la-related protein 1